MDSDQLSDLCCPICFSTYSERENVPCMLRCGHTHCKKCLENLMLRGDGRCGECRAEILELHVESLPINYSVLRVIEALKSKESKHNEFAEIEKTIDSMMTRLNENQNICRSNLHQMHQKIEELEEEKRELKEAKQSIATKFTSLSKCKSLTETLAVIKDTVSKINQLEEQHKNINERLKKDGEVGLFQSLIDEPQEFTVIVDSEKKLQTTCFYLNKNLYVRAIPANCSTEALKYEINYDLLLPYFWRTFMIIEYEGRAVMLEFELFKGNNRAKLFSQLCLGRHSISYVGANFYGHIRCGLEGESVSVGHEGSILRKSLVKDLNKGAQSVGHIKAGFVEALSTEKSKSTHFRIYLETWPSKDSKMCFAKLVRGASILKSILRNGSDIQILECGHVFDLSKKLE